MPHRMEADIPRPLMQRLDGESLEHKVGDTFLLISVGETGWPHVAMLSVGEVLAISERRLRLALWPGSHTTLNLRRTGLATLMAVVPPTTYYLRLRSEPLPDIRVGTSQRAVFEAVPTEVLDDSVAYAEVTSGIRFTLADRDRSVADWQATVRALREPLTRR